MWKAYNSGADKRVPLFERILSLVSSNEGGASATEKIRSQNYPNKRSRNLAVRRGPDKTRKRPLKRPAMALESPTP